MKNKDKGERMAFKIWIVSIILGVTMVGCGSGDTPTTTYVLDKDNLAEYESMKVFQDYAKNSGDSVSPTISDYKAIGINGIDNNKLLIEANKLIAGIAVEELKKPTDIQELLYESGVLTPKVSVSTEVTPLPTSVPIPVSTPTAVPMPMGTPTPTPRISLNCPEVDDDLSKKNASIPFEYREIETKEKTDVLFALQGESIIELEINQNDKINENGTYIDSDGYILTNKNSPKGMNALSAIDENNLRNLIKKKDCRVDITKQGVYSCRYELALDRKEYSITRIIIVKDKSCRERETFIEATAPTPDSTSTKIKWITPMDGTCTSNGGHIKHNLCASNWENAKTICSAMGGSLPTLDTLKDVVIDCGGEMHADDKEEWSKNMNNKSYHECHRDKGFTYDSYWSSNSGSSTYARGIKFLYGNDGWYSRDSDTPYVRCVLK